MLGSGVTNVTSFGSMSFGGGVLEQPDKIVSSAGAGSILIRCNPGLSVTTGLNVGNNVTGSIAGGRKLLNSVTSETLVYQLYQMPTTPFCGATAATAAPSKPSPPPTVRKK